MFRAQGICCQKLACRSKVMACNGCETGRSSDGAFCFDLEYCTYIYIHIIYIISYL